MLILITDFIWRNFKEVQNNYIDDDGNGYVDDISGINTVVRNNEGIATNNMVDETVLEPMYQVLLGQFIIIILNGVAPHVEIMPLKVNTEYSENIEDAIEAFYYAAKNGAKIIY